MRLRVRGWPGTNRLRNGPFERLVGPNGAVDSHDDPPDEIWILNLRHGMASCSLGTPGSTLNPPMVLRQHVVAPALRRMAMTLSVTTGPVMSLSSHGSVGRLAPCRSHMSPSQRVNLLLATSRSSRM